MSTRRKLALASMAGASLAAGAWLGLQEFGFNAKDKPDAKNASSSPQKTEQSPEKSLFQLVFEQPNSDPLAFKNLLGKPLLLNFWATWCPPCIAELPLIERFYIENKAKKWQVVGLAVDQMAAVQNFLRHTPLTFPMGLAGAAGIALSRGLGNVAGGLPYTVVFAADGSVAKRHMGVLTPEHLNSFAAMQI